MRGRSVLLGALSCGVMFSMVGCIAPGENVQEKQTNIQKMQDESMLEMYQNKPELKQIVKQAAGYAILKTWTMGLIPGGGSGYGVLVDNSTGKKTYLQMGQGTLGIIFMAKDGRTLLVFDDAQTMQEFTTEKWVGGGALDATFTFGEFGGQTNATGYFDKVRVYDLTENGVSLRAYLPLIKYSPYNELNVPEPK